jgi:hypothetical protein
MSKVPELRDSDGALRSQAFPHPGDALDPEPAPPASLADRHDAIDLFRRLFADCMPQRSPYRGSRRWKAGYNRMVAIAYVVTPELFVGMTQAQVAFAIGLSDRVFRRLQREAEAMLAARAQTARQRGPRRKL